MKKYNKILFILILTVILVFTAVACKEKDQDGLVKLSKPTELSLNGNAVSWAPVDNAVMYYVKVNDEEYQTTSTSYNIETQSVGVYTVKVRAYGDGKKYGTSDYSDPIEYIKGQLLDKPEVTISGTTAQWNAVDGAGSYYVKVVNMSGEVVDEQTITDTQYLFEGEKYVDVNAYTITVVAKPADDNLTGIQSKASDAVKYIVSRNLSVPVWNKVTTTSVWWNSVEGASKYEIKVTDELGESKYYSTSGTSYSISKIEMSQPGDYTLTIRAVGDGEVYLSSDFSQPNEDYILTKLDNIGEGDVSLIIDSNNNSVLSWTIDPVVNDKADKVKVILKTYTASNESKLSEVSKSVELEDGITNYSVVLNELFFNSDDGLPTRETAYYGKTYEISLVVLSDEYKIVDSDTTVTQYTYSNYTKPVYEGGAYLITNAGELAYIAVEPDASYRLINDIDFNNYEFDMIEEFSGTFNGNGKRISNIVLSGNSEYVAMFGIIREGATISNLYLKNIKAKISANVGYVGGIAAINEGTIQDCFVEGTLASYTYDTDIEEDERYAIDNVGGIVGFNKNYITDCYANVSVQGQVAGGLAALNQGTISGSYALGEITAKAYAKDYEGGGELQILAGGFVACNVKDAEKTGTIGNCFAVNNVKADGNSGAVIVAGGFAAVNEGNVYDCYCGTPYSKDVTNRLTVIASGNSSIAGGFAGINHSMIINSYSTSRASGTNVSAGFVGKNEATATIRSCFSTGGTENNGVRGGLVTTNNGVVENCYYYATSFTPRVDESGIAVTEAQLSTLAATMCAEDEDCNFATVDTMLAPVLKNMIYVKDYTLTIKAGGAITQDAFMINSNGTKINLGSEYEGTFETLGDKSVQGTVIRGVYKTGARKLQIVIVVK
ncbi:MAG: hypothetical protein ACI4MI_00920 [Christensenellales bacterium]